jgi:hypothetical protein
MFKAAVGARLSEKFWQTTMNKKQLTRSPATRQQILD